eukprot:m.144014 g.144014  ORF g.144014 m.144014 type:complete len:501 (-) comp16184_c0_seq1:1499-3001(-)
MGVDRLLFLFIGLRLISWCFLQTSFVPDEYWQGTEVAHKLVFGQGHLTWEWQAELRSYIHPAIVAAIYRVLQWLSLDTPQILAHTPTLLQCGLAGLADWYTVQRAKDKFGPQVAYWCTLALAFAWFIHFNALRQLSGTLSGLLLPVALYYWPQAQDCTSFRVLATRSSGLVIAALACIIRPTDGVIYLVLGLFTLIAVLRGASPLGSTLRLATVVTIIGASALTVMAVVDKHFYGHWTFPPLNFLHFNLLTSQADVFGTHPWHWMFTSAAPIVTGGLFPFVCYGAWLKAKQDPAPLAASVVTLALYSLPGHKEFRFIFGLLYIWIPYASVAMHQLQHRLQLSSNALLMWLLVSNVPLAVYTSMVHQRGPHAVMRHLREQQLCRPPSLNQTDVLFLTPCHTDPGHSYLHCQHGHVELHHLWCPPSPKYGLATAKDFERDPQMATQRLLHTHRPLRVVAYDHPGLNEVLEASDYRREWRTFHAHVLQSEHEASFMCVWRLIS